MVALSIFIADDVSAEIIILNQTKPDFYSVNKITLSGDIETSDLKMEGSGQVIAGTKVKVYLIGKASDVLVDEMRVNGRITPVSFDEKGYFMVLDEGEFTFHSRLKIRTLGQIRLYVPGPVNELAFDITNGYAINGNQYGLMNRDVIIQRQKKVAMLVDGQFKFTYGQRNEFNYVISYKSFGSSLGQATIDLKNNEAILSVSGANDYRVDGKRLLLELGGETATINIKGTFNQNALRVPLSEGRHNVLVESDPQKKMSVSTSAEEIDLTQSPIYPTYSNARAFLASATDVLNINLKDLKMYPSLAASVSTATNTIAITEKGSMLAELNYVYSNTGVDYIRIDAPGNPLYAGTGIRNSVKLTKDDDKLYLSLPKTQNGRLDVIYFETRSPLMPIDLVDVPVANTDLTITEATTKVILPKDYTVLWTYGAEGGSELPDGETVILFIILIGGLGYMLKKSIGYSISYIIAVFGVYLFSPTIFLITLLASIVWIVRGYLSTNNMKALLAGAGIIIALLLFVGVFFTVVSMFSSVGGSFSQQRSFVEFEADGMVFSEEAAPMLMKNSVQRYGAGDAALNVPVREGVLPVRLELPSLGKTMTVRSHLVHADDPLKISILLVNNWLKYGVYLISLFFGRICVKGLRN